MSQDTNRHDHDRTELSEDRTLLANERTFAGWMRTGFGSVGLGLGFNALTRSFDPDWIGKLIATAFFMMGIGIFIGAYRRAIQVHKRLDSHAVKAAGLPGLRLLTIGFVVITLAVATGMWLLT